MNINLKKRLFCSLLLRILIIAILAVQCFPQETKKKTLDTKIILDIAQPVFANKEMDQENLVKQLNYFLKIAVVIDEKNREKPFNLLGNQSRGKIARWLEIASEFAIQDCYKKYLHELARNIRERGHFSIQIPPWISLEQNRAEIIFPRADRYYAAVLVLKTFFNISTGSRFWIKNEIVDAIIYLNDLTTTMTIKEYTDIFPLMQNHLYGLAALANLKQGISYSPVIPSFKISQLVFTSQPEIKGNILVYPDIDNAESGDEFKIILFKNRVEAYFDGVLKPIAGRLLTGEHVWALDSEIYLSNLIMRRIAHHLGPVFMITPKGEDRTGKSGLISQKKVQKGPIEMELKTIPEVLGNLFPVMELIKSQSVAIYNTPVLVSNGLIPDVKVTDAYLIYLVSLIDRLRNTPPEMLATQQAGKKNWEDLLGNPAKENYLADLIQFNYLLANESIILNIGNRTLDIDRGKFEKAIGELAGEVIRTMAYPNYESAKWFIDKNVAIPPQLIEILKNVADIPSQIEFRLAKPGGNITPEKSNVKDMDNPENKKT